MLSNILLEVYISSWSERLASVLTVLAPALIDRKVHKQRLQILVISSSRKFHCLSSIRIPASVL